MSDALFPIPGEPARRVTRRGVYAGVNKTIRTLEDLEVVDRDRHAGLIAQARSLAGSIDRESGADPHHRQASGVSLAALHERLAALLERLDPLDQADTGGDAWHKLEQELAKVPGLPAP